MNKEQKAQAIEKLTHQLDENNIVYVADISGLNASVTSDLRRACFKADIKLEVVKNTLLAKAMEATEKDYADLPSILKGNSAIMIASVANAPGKIIKEFRKKSDKPILKGAFINSDIYIGDNQLDTLASIKSKEEMVGEVIGLLQSPARRIIAALQHRFEKEQA